MIKYSIQMKKIYNAYRKLPDYLCFGCSPDNSNGLQMQFFEDEDYVFCKWQPKNHFQGYFNVLHGGIQMTLLDEIANWVVNIKVKTAGLTVHSDIHLKKSIFISDGEITIRGKLREMKRNIAIIDAEILNHNNEIASTATVEFFTYPQKLAEEKLHYPGYEAFLSE